MSLPQNRTELKEWALRKLGRPVIRVNIDPAQMEDRISEAIDLFQTYHNEGTERIYLQHTITAADIANGFIDLPDSVVSIKRALPLKTKGDYLFNVRYHYALNTIPSLMGFDLISFDMFNKHLALIDHLLSPQASLSFNRITGKLFLNIDWGHDVVENDVIVLETSTIVDPANFPVIYGNEWVRNYTVALFRQQWAQNMGKYRGIMLPGNVTLDVESMERKAEADIEKLLDELNKKFQIPAHFIVG